jgi:hypothetical protein
MKPRHCAEFLCLMNVEGSTSAMGTTYKNNVFNNL